MHTRHLVRFVVSMALAALAFGPASLAEDPPWSAPAIERAIAVWDARSGEPSTLDALLDHLAEQEVVFLGEIHTDETTQRLELAIYEGLLARREGKVVLALEMFERDVQPTLDAYVGGSIDEEAFLEGARPWPSYAEAYRPLIERARQGGHPVVASNMPRPLIRRVAMEGWDVVEGLPEDERVQAPETLFPNTPLYWKRADNSTRGHLMARMMRSQGGPQRLTTTQSLWDNTMGESCVRALEEHPGAMVLHVNGDFHSAYREGTVHQLLARRPETRAATVSMLPDMSPGTAELPSLPSADFVVFTEARASGSIDRLHGVALSQKLRYRLRLPDSARPSDALPLLIWLGADGLNADDGIDLWRDVLGEEAVIAALDPPYRAQLPDLSEGGRWFWSNTFLEDHDAVSRAVERVWAYLVRRHPVDPERVVIAGEGSGATLVAALPLVTERLRAEALAFEPSSYSRIRDLPLPLPEDRAPDQTIDVSLTVLTGTDDAAWWTKEVSSYKEVGLSAEFEEMTESGVAGWRLPVDRVRQALGLESSATEIESVEQPQLVAPADSPRARHWTRIEAMRRSGEADARTSLAIGAEEAAARVPRCPGPFGGTTVLVLPEGLSDEEQAAWSAMEENDPLAAESRFHRVRVATSDEGEGGLKAVLEKLQGEGRKNVLIVPATFCAEPSRMQALERLVRDFQDRMTITWTPGLGAPARR